MRVTQQQQTRDRQMFEAQHLEILKEVASAMGGKFVNAQEDNCTSYVHIELPDGRELGFYMPWNGKGKASLRGHYPKVEGREIDPRLTRFMDYNSEAPNIGLSLTKSVDRIVKDIEKRFMPEYTELYNNLLTVKAEQENYKNQHQTEIDFVAGELGEESNTDGKIYSKIGDIRVEAKVYVDSTTLELDGLTREQVKAVLDLVKGF
jgi:hypothetical protein